MHCWTQFISRCFPPRLLGLLINNGSEMPLGNLSQTPGRGKRPKQLLVLFFFFYPPLSLTSHLSGGEGCLLCFLRKVITLSEIKEKKNVPHGSLLVFAKGFSTEYFCRTVSWKCCAVAAAALCASSAMCPTSKEGRMDCE